MCLTCNPYCGRCHPPRKRRPARCAACGRMNDFDRGEGQGGCCSFCGAELPKMRTQPTVRCRYSGELCSDPCGRSKEWPEDGRFRHCDRRTPPLSAAQFAKTLRHGPSEA